MSTITQILVLSTKSLTTKRQMPRLLRYRAIALLACGWLSTIEIAPVAAMRVVVRRPPRMIIFRRPPHPPLRFRHRARPLPRQLFFPPRPRRF
jgi:hypothetical protein